MVQIDQKMISQYLNVSVPNVSDALDRMGIEGSTQGVLPIYTCAKIAGPAATLKYIPYSAAEESTVLGTLKAIVHGGAGSVLVVDASDNVYGLPVYARGIAQQSVRGRSSCAGYGIPVKLSGVPVRPGDFILADENGTVVIPMEYVSEVLAFAQKVKATEEEVIAQIRAGADPVEAHVQVNYDNMLKKQATE